MPLLKFDIIAGRDVDRLRTLVDTAYQAMVEAFQVPQRDRCRCVTQRRPDELVIEDTGPGYTRSKDAVLRTVVSRPRPEAQKTGFYRLGEEEARLTDLPVRF